MGDERKPPAYRVLSTQAIVLAAIGLLCASVGLATWLLLAYGSGTDADKIRLDAIKTAGTIVVGTGGAAALWLAARRQQAAEIALRQKDIDQAHQERVAAHNESVAAAMQAHQERVASRSEHDAAERRVTELYMKAVEQLGSDRAAVRLGGMYALERLAHNVPEQRQTIVNVLCAYLRMPYRDPMSQDSAVDGEQGSLFPGLDAMDGHASDAAVLAMENYQQEGEVRMAVQRILLAHLRHGRLRDMPNEKFWPDIDIDLCGATLKDFDLGRCEIRSVRFAGARFTGHAEFGASKLGESANFEGAIFDGDARFDGAKFGRWARFERIQIAGLAGFSGAIFDGSVSFDKANFGEIARFGQAVFRHWVRFSRAIFRKSAMFDAAEFRSEADFSYVSFKGEFRLNRLTFGNVTFFEEVTFEKAEFGLPADFDGARVRLGASVRYERVWPNWLYVREEVVVDASKSSAAGHWGYLMPAASESAE